MYTVGSSVSALSGLYTTVMKASGASRRVFQLLDRVSSMPNSGDKCPIKLVSLSVFWSGCTYSIAARSTFNIDDSFFFSEKDGEVELDDVWFSYPSRPSHMILKVFSRILCN